MENDQNLEQDIITSPDLPSPHILSDFRVLLLKVPTVTKTMKTVKDMPWTYIDHVLLPV